MTPLLTKSFKMSFSGLLLLFCVSASAYDVSLKTMIRTNYPDTALQSRFSLIKYILEGTGYKLYFGSNAPSDVRNILSKKRVPIQVKDILVSREDALLMATGEDTILIVDPDNKLVSFTKDYNNEI